MIKVNGFDVKFSPINNYATTPMFKGTEMPQNSAVAKCEKLPDVAPDYNIKKPISYNKTDEVDLPQGLKAHCYKLANGQKVVIVPKDGPTIIKTYVKTGSMNETDNIRGISHFLEHNFFNGSEGLEAGEFFKKVDAMGAYTNAATGMAETNYYIKSNLLGENDLKEQIRIHASMLQSPKFAPEMLEKEKHIVNSEINMITSDPENIGMHTVLRNLYGINSTSSDLIGGTTDNITNLTREDVVNYFNQNYYPANMTTVITGDVDENEVINLIAKNFNSMKQPPKNRYYEPLAPIQMPIRQDIISSKTKGTLIYTAFDGPKSDNTEDKIKMLALTMLLSNIKSSRLDERLKDYGVHITAAEEKVSSKEDGEVANLFMCKTTEKDSEKVLRILFDELEKIKKNPPSAEEMEILKKQLLLSFSQAFEFSEEVNGMIGEALTSGGFSELTEFENIIKNLTPQDLSDTAKKYFDFNKVSVAVIHPESATEKSINENYKNAREVSFGHANCVIKKDNFNQYLLPNNMNVITNDIKGDRCSMDIQFKVPPEFRTPENIGATLILNEILSKGTFNKDEKTFTNDLQKSGIALSEIGGADMVFSAQFSHEDLDQTISAIKEIYYSPRFKETEFNQAKNDIIKGLSIHKETTKDFTRAAIFKGEVEGMPPKLILKSVENTSFDDVINLYRQITQNASGTAVISAPFKKNPELKNELFTQLNEFENIKPFKFEYKDNYKTIEKPLVIAIPEAGNQAKIMETFTFKNSFNIKDIAALTLMNDILGGSSSSRLFTDLRENRKLAYNVQSNFETVGNTGLISLSIKTTTDNKETGEVSYDNLQKSIDGFNENINKIINEKVSDEELNNAKLSLKNSLLSGAESSFAKTYHLLKGVTGSYYGADYVNRMFETIDEITVDDIQRAAKYAFKNKPVYAIGATKETLLHNKEYLNNLSA